MNEGEQTLAPIDLRTDPQAALYVKDEVVDVEFARADGVLQSREGPNRYRAGDALVTAAGGDRWSVSRERFDAKYLPEPPAENGRDGRYRNRPLPVWARQIAEAFVVHRSADGDLLHGKAGDWLLQYAPGDYGVVDARRFARVYRRTAGESGNGPPCA